MKSYILPVLLVAIAAGAFTLYINPTYIEVQDITADIAEYDEALNNSKELLAVREELVSRYNSFSKSDLDRLLKLLPDNVDNVRLILDLDTLASQFGMRLTNITITETPAETGIGAELCPNTNKHRSIDIGFTTSGTYQDFRRYLQALETSLRVVDIKSLGFSSQGERGVYTYQVLLSTYWLK